MISEKEKVEELQAEIFELKRQLWEQEELIREISVPIIPSIIPETILVPITGKLSSERFDMITSKILETSHANEVATVIIDFTAISEREIGEVELFGSYIQQLTAAVRLMGIQILFVGFGPAVIQLLISSGLSNSQDIKTFLTFRTALQYLMMEKGMEFEKM